MENEQYQRRDAVYLLFSRDPNTLYVNCSLESATALIRTETIAEMCRPYESRLEFKRDYRRLSDGIADCRNQDLVAALTAQPCRFRREVSINFAFGDYVMKAKVERGRTDEDDFEVRWVGPLRIIGVANPWVYKVAQTFSDRAWYVHCERLRFYASPLLESVEPLSNLVAHNADHYEIERILDHERQDSDTYCLKVTWFGFEPIESSWQPIDDLYRADRVIVRRYVDSLQNDADGTSMAYREMKAILNLIP